ncbi:MAG TPA: class I SAM-dependent methyltransferase [Acidimicrobiales bacterium]|nr:class I SAM-dependent methyltransferase [Acidimicrobiales bacterium]
MARLTGERPLEGITPDSLLALHGAGYRAVRERLGPGRMLDVGCGQGFESARFAAPDRSVVGVDYSFEAALEATARFGPRGLKVAQCDARRLSLGTGTFDWVCSSHLIEHFPDAEAHVAELARVLATGGKAFVVTPNAPADFENPFHIRLFRASELTAVLQQSFDDVWVGGIDAVAKVKDDLRRRREKAAKVLAIDVFDLRHRIPRSWYVGVYTRILPLAYRFMAKGDAGGGSGITDDDFFVTEDVDDTTLVLLAVAGKPRRREPVRGERAGP